MERAGSQTRGEASPRFDFGEFELRMRPYELFRAGESVDLAPQPLRLLGLLVERAGEVVHREEIRRALWGTDTHVDFDRSINYNVRQIRRALGDDADRPRFVETLPRAGYRFIPQPTRRASPRPEAEVPFETEDRSSANRDGDRRWWISSALAAGVVALFLVLPALFKVWYPGTEAATHEHAAYARARLLLHRENLPAQRATVQAFAQAVEESPDFAPAHAGLARAYLRQEQFAQARAAAQQAIHLDRQQGEARYVLALMAFLETRRWDEAEEHLRIALSGDSATLEAVVLYGDLLIAQGRFEEAEERLEEEAVRNPQEMRIPMSLALSNFLARDFGDAAMWARRGLELDPGRNYLQRLLISSLAFDGRGEEALEAANTHLESWGLPRAAERLEDWWRICLEIEGLPRPGPLTAHYSTRAAWLVAVDRHDEAIEALSEACRQNLVLDLAFLPYDPRFDALRRDPRFHQILECLPREAVAGDQPSIDTR